MSPRLGSNSFADCILETSISKRPRSQTVGSITSFISNWNSKSLRLLILNQNQLKMEPIVPIAILSSLILGALIAFVAFSSYFRKRKSEVASIAKPAEAAAPNLKNSKPQQTKKSQSKPHHSHADKVKKIISDIQLIIIWSDGPMVMCLLIDMIFGESCDFEVGGWNESLILT